ncbi:MAG: hypothetical protein QOI50_5161, partial [Pseudonocardiales bacterium]|nr:hypothetical protein [Pseudonocardiales bacterium]
TKDAALMPASDEAGITVFRAVFRRLPAPG